MQAAITQSDVAREAGVSRGLVSLALADSPRVATETKERIREVAARLGYSRNFGAAALASSRSMLIGVVLPNLRNPYFESLVAAFQAESEARGYTVLTATASGDEARERAMLEHFQTMRVGGLILATPSRPASHYVSIASRLPLVIAGSPYDGGPAHVVHIDEFEAARIAVTHAVDRGYCRVVYLAEDVDSEAAGYRRAAIVAAAEAAGLEVDVMTPVASAEQFGTQAKREPGSVCIFAHNDYLAIDVVSQLRQAGIVPGSDVGIISYDNTFLARHAGFDLTSIDQRPDVQAKLALDAIEALAADSDPSGGDIVVSPQLVVRTSS